MKAIRVVGIVVLVVLLVVVGGSYLLPSEIQAERTAVIQAPPAVVFAQVNDLEKYNQWNPWMTTDPNMTIAYGATKVGQGAKMTWESQEHGAGTMTITQSNPPTDLTTALTFGPRGAGTGRWQFEDADGATKVTWGMTGDADGVIGRWMGVMISKAVGPQFEKGLAALAEQAEAAPPMEDMAAAGEADSDGGDATTETDEAEPEIVAGGE